MKNIAFTILLLLCVGTTFSQSQQLDYQMVDSVISNFRAKWKIPGVSVAIAKDGRLIYAKGFGYADTAAKEVVTPYSMFRIASCSKTITATGVMRLIQSKRLNINDTVFGPRGILNDPSYTFTDARIRSITVKNLLQQTIGWNKNDAVGSNDPSYALKTATPSTPHDLIRFNLQRGLDFAPTKSFRYSNFNYIVLGEIIRKVTGLSYEAYISNEVLNPIGATYTMPGNTLLGERLKHEVRYYESVPEACTSVFDTTQQVPMSYGAFYLPTMHASGGWVSRPIDLVKLLLAIEGNGSSRSILTKETAELMRTTPDSIESSYAMGLAVSEEGWTHSGALTWGTSSLIHRMPNGVCYAIICNTLASKPGTDEQKFSAMVEYITELYDVLAKPLHGISIYPNVDLFGMYDKAPEQTR